MSYFVRVSGSCPPSDIFQTQTPIRMTFLCEIFCRRCMISFIWSGDLIFFKNTASSTLPLTESYRRLILPFSILLKIPNGRDHLSSQDGSVFLLECSIRQCCCCSWFVASCGEPLNPAGWSESGCTSLAWRSTISTMSVVNSLYKECNPSW